MATNGSACKLPEVHVNRTLLRAMAASPTEQLGGDETVEFGASLR